MSSEPKEWDEKVDMTWREYFNPPWMLPHIGIVKLARRIEKELGKENAHQIIKEVAFELATEWTKEKTKGFKVNKLSDVEHAMNIIRDDPIMRAARAEGNCLWAYAYGEMGAVDIGYLWVCNGDEAIMKALNPQLEFSQGETLMIGNDHCDNQVSWKEE